MSKLFNWVGALVLACLLGSELFAALGGDPADVTIDGSIGLDQALANSCIAVWVPLAKNLAISGVTWYNNDGTLEFPEVLVQGGFADRPAAVDGALSVATHVLGSSSGWSEVAFSQPVTTNNDGLYVIFMVQSGSSALSEGAGGGPAIGYTRSGGGLSGWLSADGDDWMQIHPSCGLAVVPTVVPATAGTAAKSNASPKPRNAAPEVTEPGPAVAENTTTVTGMSPASPNPFNPRTTLSFTLDRDDDVELAIYSVRGELVSQLLNERMSRGAHSVVWDGTDRRGLGVASGVYLVRFTAGSLSMTQRLVLMR